MFSEAETDIDNGISGGDGRQFPFPVWCLSPLQPTACQANLYLQSCHNADEEIPQSLSLYLGGQIRYKVRGR
jgi:hypothetical protein